MELNVHYLLSVSKQVLVAEKLKQIHVFIQGFTRFPKIQLSLVMEKNN